MFQYGSLKHGTDRPGKTACERQCCERRAWTSDAERDAEQLIELTVSDAKILEARRQNTSSFWCGRLTVRNGPDRCGPSPPSEWKHSGEYSRPPPPPSLPSPPPPTSFSSYRLGDENDQRPHFFADLYYFDSRVGRNNSSTTLSSPFFHVHADTLGGKGQLAKWIRYVGSSSSSSFFSSSSSIPFLTSLPLVGWR
ncbi:hypothetical protein E2C01_028296 [Portunus trituberculatus]|uniref:Uncharacterized protein n=1 Tax=Portunus trituberculatus TaxID=210409 RepID=A0A5B7EPM8_PORTR|nr:hypothetical protein [Portunus trituberculatus]